MKLGDALHGGELKNTLSWQGRVIEVRVIGIQL